MIFYDFTPNFLLEAGQILERSQWIQILKINFLNFILNTILRTLVAKETIKIFRKKNLKKKLKKTKWACDTVLKIAASNNRDWKWMKILKTDSVQGVSLLPPALLVQKETLQNYMKFQTRGTNPALWAELAVLISIFLYAR